MIDLPSEVVFDSTPYGVAAERPLFLMNDSNEPITLTFTTDGPFCISPASVRLGPMMPKQFTLTCNPVSTGKIRGMLHVSLNNALFKSIPLLCESYSAQFKLERTVVDNFPKTLITHTATAHVDLINTSDTVTTFSVKAYPYPQNGSDPDFQDMMFPFSIFPPSGTIYPTSKCSYTITFQPSVSGPHDTTAWIECTGSKERQPLRMRALAVGPDVDFDCDELRFKSVVVGASARGEVVLTNHSEIEIEFHLMPTEEHDPSYVLQYNCVSGVIPPNSHIVIELTFTPHVIKSYTIPSLWSILGLSTCLVVEIKATAVAPGVEMKSLCDTLTETHLRVLVSDKRLRRRIVDEQNGRRGVYYDDEHSDAEHMSWLSKEFLTINDIDKDRIIDFDQVAFSFSSSKDLRVRNLSQLECDFTLKIEPSSWVFEHENEGNCDSKHDVYLACADFNVSPANLHLKPGADAHISLTILPRRRAGVYKDINLNLYHAASMQPLQTVQIIGSVVNSRFNIEPTVVNIPEGYVGYKHNFNIRIKNVASVIGKWSFPVQDILDSCLVTCSKGSGVLLPGAEEVLVCGIIPRSQGHLVIPVTFTSDAYDKQTLSCMVQYSAGGPRVEAKGSLEFSQPNNKESYVRVLDVMQLNVHLRNVGLTSARCRIVPEKHGSPFSVEKGYNDTILAPEESASIPVTFYTTEAGVYKENMLVYVTLVNAGCSLSEDTIKATSSVLKVPLYASAKGTNLFCPHQDLNKDPIIDCGTWFATEELHYNIVIQNHGSFVQNCTWVYIGNPGVKKGQDNINCLHFEQDRAQLQPGAFHTFQLKGRTLALISNGQEIYQLKSNFPGKETKVAFQVTFRYSFISSDVAATELLLPLGDGTQTVSLCNERHELVQLGNYSFIERNLVFGGHSPSNVPSVTMPTKSVDVSVTNFDVSASSAPPPPSNGKLRKKKQKPSLLNFVYEEFPVIASPNYFLDRVDTTSQFLGANNIPFNTAPPVPLSKFIVPEGDFYVRHELTKFVRLVNTSALPGRLQILIQAPFRVRVIAKGNCDVSHYIHDTLALEAGMAEQIEDMNEGENFISATMDNASSPCRVPGDADINSNVRGGDKSVIDELDDISVVAPTNMGSPIRGAAGVKQMSEESEIPMKPTKDTEEARLGDPLNFPAFAQTATVDLLGNGEEACIIEISVDIEYIRMNLLSKFLESALVIRLLPPKQAPISIPTVTLPMKLSAYFPSLEFRSCPLSTLEEHGLDIYAAYSTLSNSVLAKESELKDSTTGTDKAIIDFGMANVGTTVTQVIICKNISRFPVRFQWLLQMEQGTTKFKYDISPLGVDAGSGLLPNHLAKFNISFIGQSNEIVTDKCMVLCSIDGGEVYSYGLQAGTSNLEADVKPSSINYGDIVFSSEQSSTITISNKSPMQTTVILSIPYDCRPFLTRVSNTVLQALASPSEVSDFIFKLDGHSTLEIPIFVRPLIPGLLYIPLSIKIGYLERLIIPITARAYIERPVLVSGSTMSIESGTTVANILRPAKYLLPWDNNSTGAPLSEILPYNAFLVAADLFIRKVEADSMGLQFLADDPASEMSTGLGNTKDRIDHRGKLISTLDKKIGPDGTLEVYGQRYDPQGTETMQNPAFIESLQKDYVIASVANDLIHNFLEFYKYYSKFPVIGAEDIIDLASRSTTASGTSAEKKMSITRTRLLSPSMAHRLATISQMKPEKQSKSTMLDEVSVLSRASTVRTTIQDKQPTHLNDSQYHYLREKTSTDYLCKKHVLFNAVVTLPPVIRGTKTSQTITIYNKGSIPMHISFDRRFLQQAGASVEPEKVSRLPTGEGVSLTISYTSSHKSSLGDYTFIIPLEFKQTIIGILTCNVFVTLPTVRPVNLSVCSANFTTLPVKESDAYVLNFGHVLHGRAKMFTLRMENPTAVSASYTFEVFSGVVSTVKHGDKHLFSVEAPFLGNDPNVFTLVAPENGLVNYGSLVPKTNNLFLDVVFKPADYFPDSTDSTYFRGSIVFQVKMGGQNGHAAKVPVHFVGIGYHPAVYLTRKLVEFLPLFPMSRPGSLEVVELVNDSSEAHEVYLKEFDKYNHVERFLYSAIARSYGKALVADKKSIMQPLSKLPDGTQGDPTNGAIYKYSPSYTPSAYNSNSPAVLALLGKQDVLETLAAASAEQRETDVADQAPEQSEVTVKKPVPAPAGSKQALPAMYSYILNEIPTPGSTLGPVAKKLLNDLKLDRLTAWFEQFYEPPKPDVPKEDSKPATSVEPTHKPEKGRASSVRSDRGGSAKRESAKPAHPTTEPHEPGSDPHSMVKSDVLDASTLEVRDSDSEQKYEDETAKHLNQPVSQDDFAYDLCPIEILTQKYARTVPSVIRGRSYRIASTDVCLSNLPFLVYVIHGPPLAGKTSLANKIYSLYNNGAAYDVASKDVQMPILSLEHLLADSQAYKDVLVKVVQWEEATKKVSEPTGKNVPKKKADEVVPAVDPMKESVYFDALADALYTGIITAHGLVTCAQDELEDEGTKDRAPTYTHNLTGLIFDSLTCSAVRDAGDSVLVLTKMCTKYFMKPAIHAVQNMSSRLLLHSIVLDCTPVDSRRRAMEIVIGNYKSAELNMPIQDGDEPTDLASIQRAESNMKMMKLALSSAKKKYDKELELAPKEVIGHGGQEIGHPGNKIPILTESDLNPAPAERKADIIDENATGQPEEAPTTAYFTPGYENVFVTDDPHGSAHLTYLQSVTLVNAALAMAQQLILDSHRESIDAYKMSGSTEGMTPEELNYRNALEVLSQAQEALAHGKKADQKKLQAAVDEAAASVEELKKTLPPHPISDIREDNLFTVTYLNTSAAAKGSEESVLGDVLTRICKAYVHYMSVLRKKQDNLAMYSSVRSISGQGTFSDFYHLQTNEEIYLLETVQRIVDIIFSAADFKNDGASLSMEVCDTPDADRSTAPDGSILADTTGQDTSQTNPAVQKKGRSTRTPIQALSKMLQKHVRSPNFATLKNVANAIVNREYMSPKSMLEGLYNAAIFEAEQEKTFKRITRVLPANAASIIAYKNMQRTLQTIDAEIRDLQAGIAAKGTNAKQLAQQLSEKQAEKDASENGVRTLFNGADITSEVGPTRWILKPHSRTLVGFRFVSNSIMTTKLRVHFGIRGCSTVLPLIFVCKCDFPHIIERLNVVFPAHAATKSGKSLMEYSSTAGEDTTGSLAHLASSGPRDKEDTGEMSETPNANDTGKPGSKLGITQLQASTCKAHGGQVALFSFGFLRSGLHRPEFFSLASGFSNPYNTVDADSETAAGIQAKTPATKGKQSRPTSSTTHTKQPDAPQNVHEGETAPCLLTQLDTVTHQRACKYITDSICKFTPQHIEVLNIVNDSYFETTIGFMFDLMVKSLAGSDNGSEQVNLASEESVGIVKENLQKIFATTDPSVPLTDILADGPLQNSKGGSKQPARPGAKGAVAAEADPIFFVYPHRLTLKPGERSAVYITCFPPENKYYKGTLFIGVDGNPGYMSLGVSCIGQTPQIEYQLPDCAEDLMPCSSLLKDIDDLTTNSQRYLTNGYKLDVKDIVFGAKGAAKLPAKGKDTQQDSAVQQMNNIFIPRVPTSTTEALEIPIKNTSQLPLMVEYSPMHKDLSMLSAITQVINYPEYAVKSAVKTTKYPKSTRIADQHYSWKINSTLLINNSRFYLGPGESGVLSVEYTNSAEARMIMPGKLFVRQHVGGLKNIPENEVVIDKGKLKGPRLPSLDALAKTFLEPVVEYPLNVICESHKVDVFTTVVGISESPDRIPTVVQGDSAQFDTTKPNNHLNLGIVRALVCPTKAEIMLVNNGPYPVGYKLVISRAFKDIVYLIDDLEVGEKVEKGRKPDPTAQAKTAIDPDIYKLVNTKTGTLGIDEANRPPSRSNPPAKQGKGAQDTGANKVRIGLIIRIPDAKVYEKVPIVQVTFFEPLTNMQLARNNINLTAEAVFSQAKIQPERNIVFGEHPHGKVVTKTINIRNDGHFPFLFFIEPIAHAIKRWLVLGSANSFTDYTKQLAGTELDVNSLRQFGVNIEPTSDLFKMCVDSGLVQPTSEQKAGSKAADKKGASAVGLNLSSMVTLQSGPFIIQPALLYLAPQESKDITVSFTSRSNENWRDYFVIDYTNRPPDYFGGSAITESYLNTLLASLNDAIKASPASVQNYVTKVEDVQKRLAKLQYHIMNLPLLRYSLSATSIIPGIITTNYSNIFEEQALSNHLPANPSLLLGGPTFSPISKIFCMGPCVIGNELTERIKITNPYTVPCTVVAFLNFDQTKMNPQNLDGLISAFCGETSTQVVDFFTANMKRSAKSGDRALNTSSVQEKAGQTAAKGKPVSDKKDTQLISNDNEAWSLEQQFIKLYPNESAYITIKYAPSLQVASRCQLICVVIDQHFSVVNLIKEGLPGTFGLAQAQAGTQKQPAASKGAPAQDHVILQQLEDGIQEQDLVRRRLSFMIEATGVLPEISFSPQSINLGKIVIGASSADLPSQIISIQNTGRVKASYAIVITAENPRHADCFTLLPSTGRSSLHTVTDNGDELQISEPVPQGKLFTGLVVLHAATKNYFTVAPNADALEGFANGEVVCATLGIKVMTSVHDYTVADIPLQCTVVSSKLNAIEGKFLNKVVQKMYEDTVAFLFGTLGNPKLEHLTSIILSSLADSKAYDYLRQNEIAAYGAKFLSTTISNRANIYLKDLALNTIVSDEEKPSELSTTSNDAASNRPKSRQSQNTSATSSLTPLSIPQYMTITSSDLYNTEVILQNTSTNHIRFEFNVDICRKIGVIVHPAVGHIHAGTKKTIAIRLTCPGNADDFATLLAAPGAKAAAVKTKRAPSKYGQTILFGTPLICQYYPIVFQPGRRVGDWDTSQTTVSYVTNSAGVAVRTETICPEPEYQVYLDEDEIRALLEEMVATRSSDDSVAARGGKNQATTQGKGAATGGPISRTALLQELLADVHAPENRIALASSFLELDLFGFAGDFTVKCFAGSAGSDLVPLALKTSDPAQYSALNFPLVNTPILQKSSASLYLLNDSQTSPVVVFNSLTAHQYDSPYAITSLSADETELAVIPAKPDGLAALVREFYPALPEIPSLANVMTKFGLSSKTQVDKNVLAAAQTMMASTNPGTNKYLVGYDVAYEPRLPGVYKEEFHSTAGNIAVVLSSTAILPVCHLECNSNNVYLQTMRSGSLKTPQIFANLICSNPKAVKVLEIVGQGVGITITNHITVLNCINQPYDVTLQRLPESSSCIVSTFGAGGKVSPGETSIIRFDYTPTRESSRVGVEEGFFIIRIPQHDVTLPLLVVGRPVEPEVVLSTNKLAFDPILVGNCATKEVVLSNNEKYPLNYKIRLAQPAKEMVDDDSANTSFQCTITPTAGILCPMSSTSILFNVKPTCEGRVNQLIRIVMPRRSVPLSLNVKYEAFYAKHLLELLPNTPTGLPTQLGSYCELDFETVFLSDYRQRTLKLSNIGSHEITCSCTFSLKRQNSTARRDEVEFTKAKKCVQYEWETTDGDKEINTVAKHTIRPGDHVLINIKFQPTLELRVTKDFGLSFLVSVEGSSTQEIRLMGTGLKPGLHTETTRLDYGSALNSLRHDKYVPKIVSFTNRDVQPLTLEYCIGTNDFFIDTPPLSDPLPVGKTHNIAVKFIPNYAGKFKDVLTVMVNGLYKLRYPLTGQGIDCGFALHDTMTGSLINSYSNLSTSHPVTVVNLGSTSLSSPPIIKTVNFKNTTSAIMNVRMAINDASSDEIPKGLFLAIVPADQYHDYVTKCMEMLDNWSNRNTKQIYLNGLPKVAEVLPDHLCTLMIMHSPIARSPQFQVFASLSVEDSVVFENVISIKGAVLGSSAKLVNQNIEMPPCIVHSFVSRNFMIENVGDTELCYKIPVPPKKLVKRSLLELFEKGILTVSPTSGLIPVGASATITIKFAPTQPARYFIPSIPVECFIEGENTVIGEASVRCACLDKKGIETDSTVQEIQLACNARESTSIMLHVDNNTDTTFVVRSILDGPDTRQFQVPERLSIPPGGLDFKVIYSPLLMAELHRADLYIAGADGGANIWALHGKVSKPLDEGVVTNMSESEYDDIIGKSGASVAIVGKDKSKQEPAASVAPTLPHEFVDSLLKVQNVVHVSTEATCYRYTTFSFPLRNWEKRMQRFNFQITFVDPSLSTLCQLSYPEVVDAPAIGTVRNVELGFMPFVSEKLFAGTISFVAHETKEALVYRFMFMSGGPPVMGRTSFETTVRDPVEKLITIPNPLLSNKTVSSLTLTASCERDDITVTPETVTFSNKTSTYSFKVKFNPYVPFNAGRVNTKIEFDVAAILSGVKKSKLCRVEHALDLQCHIPRPSSPMKVQADMDTTLPFTVTLVNNLRPNPNEKITYALGLTDIHDISKINEILYSRASGTGSGAPAKGSKDTGLSIIDGKSIQQNALSFSLVANEVVAMHGQSFTIQLRFAPQSFGEYSASLVVYNPQGGLWVIPLIGKCTRPPASGTITVTN